MGQQALSYASSLHMQAEGLAALGHAVHIARTTELAKPHNGFKVSPLTLYVPLVFTLHWLSKSMAKFNVRGAG